LRRMMDSRVCGGIAITSVQTWDAPDGSNITTRAGWAASDAGNPGNSGLGDGGSGRPHLDPAFQPTVRKRIQNPVNLVNPVNPGKRFIALVV
jgi:hypothetical protein